MASVLCHMESYTTSAYSSGSPLLHFRYMAKISGTWLRQMMPWAGAIMSKVREARAFRAASTFFP